MVSIVNNFVLNIKNALVNQFTPDDKKLGPVLQRRLFDGRPGEVVAFCGGVCAELILSDEWGTVKNFISEIQTTFGRRALHEFKEQRGESFQVEVLQAALNAMPSYGHYTTALMRLYFRIHSRIFTILVDNFLQKSLKPVNFSYLSPESIDMILEMSIQNGNENTTQKTIQAIDDSKRMAALSEKTFYIFSCWAQQQNDPKLLNFLTDQRKKEAGSFNVFSKALNSAVQERCNRTVKLLILGGLEKHCSSVDLDGLLTIAVGNGDAETLEILLNLPHQMGSNAFEIGLWYEIALQAAVKSNKETCVQVILANPLVNISHFADYFSIARQNEYLPTIALLLSRPEAKTALTRDDLMAILKLVVKENKPDMIAQLSAHPEWHRVPLSLRIKAFSKFTLGIL